MINKLKADKVMAMKSGDSVKKTFLSTLISDIEMVAKNDNGREVTDQDAIKVMEKFKKGAEEILRHKPYNDESLREIRWLEVYLPFQLGEDALLLIIKQVLDHNPDAKLGDIMKELKTHFSGQYNGKTASILARTELGL